MEQILTTEEMARFLRVSEKTLLTLAKEGRFGDGAYKVSDGTFRFDREKVLRAITIPIPISSKEGETKRFASEEAVDDRI
jgi:excisionase family DNA binding protein